MIKIPYRREKDGRIARLWYNMNERSIKDGYPYSKGEVVSKEDFLEFAKNSKEYNEMYDAWKESNFEYGLAPTIDRINSKGPYSLENLQFLTFAENARKNHDREKYKNITYGGVGMSGLNKVAQFALENAGILNSYEENKRDIDSCMNKKAEEIKRNLDEFNSILSKNIEKKLEFGKNAENYSLLKAASFAIKDEEIFKESSLNKYNLEAAIENRFNVIEKLAEEREISEEAEKFLKLAYLTIAETDFPEDEKVKMLLIQDMSSLPSIKLSYNLFSEKIETEETKIAEDNSNDNCELAINDSVLNIIRQEMENGEDIADGLAEDPETGYNALPLPHKEKVDEIMSRVKNKQDEPQDIQPEKEEDKSKISSVLTTLGLATAGGALGRSGVLNGNKVRMDRSDGLAAGALSGMVAGQVLDDAYNGKSDIEVLREAAYPISLEGAEGAAAGALLGYNIPGKSSAEKIRNAGLGALGGGMATEVLRRLF